jgi:membrane-bound serine protease (ClpP class)
MMSGTTMKFGRRPTLPGAIGTLGRALLVIGMVWAIASAMLSPGALAQSTPVPLGGGGDGSVMVIPIKGTIEPGLGHYLERSIHDAEQQHASAIILDIDTPGGRLDTVLEMRDAILDTDIPVVAFVNRQAFSAGALITIASDQIWMTPAAVFGAATPVSGSGETASEKTISAVRSVFRSTAEHQGRDPAIAEAMVDPAVEVPGLDSSTSLLTLSTDQARAHGYADGVANSRADLLAQLGLADAEVTVASPTLMERATRWITDPGVASLLILLGLALIVVDGIIGGLGVVARVGAGLLGLFFWGHMIADLAGWEDLILIVVGLVLIGIEVFVIPGFGLAGILGLLSLVGGLVLSMTRRSIGDQGFAEEAGGALKTMLITLAATVFVIAVFSWALPRLVPSIAKKARGPQRLTLSATVDEGGDEMPKPGRFTRILGGHDVVERDAAGHTAIPSRPRPEAQVPRDPGA